MKVRFAFLLLMLLLAGCSKYTGPDFSDDGLPPAVPVNLRIYYAGDGELSFVWTKNKETDFAAYYIYKLQVGGTYTRVDTVFDNYYFDTVSSYDSIYSFKVSASDRFGRESVTSSAINIQAPNNYPPLKPGNLLCNGKNWNGTKSITLSWKNQGDYDIKEYLIYRSIAAAFTPDSSLLIGRAANTLFEDTTSLVLNRDYYYKIVARDRGNLLSVSSDVASDRILAAPELITPAEGSIFSSGTALRFIVLPAGTTFNVSVMATPFGSDIWTSDNTLSSGTTETFYLPEYLLTAGVQYYWKINTFTKGSVPNSVSSVRSFRYLR